MGTIPERVAVAEAQITDLRSDVTTLAELPVHIAGIRSDMSHIMQGAAVLTTSVQQLASAAADRRVTDAAVSSALDKLAEEVRELRDTHKARVASRATIVSAAVSGVFALVISLL